MRCSLFCNNSPNSSDSSLYDWYDDGFRILVHRCVALLSELMISLPVINCKKSDSYYPCNERIYCFKWPRDCRSWSVAGSDLINFKISGAFSYHRDSPWPQKTGYLKIWESNQWFHNWWPAIHNISWFLHYILTCKFWDYLQNVFFSLSSIALVLERKSNTSSSLLSIFPSIHFWRVSLPSSEI